MRTQEGKEAKALAIIRRLREQGFEAYLAGGCVRDRLLGAPAKDYDIAADARPDVVRRLFDQTVAVGARFGVIIVVMDGEQFEVATFRADAPYLDGRRPSDVRFGSIEEDARRRDFTINGMYLDPQSERVIDLVGGMSDLRAGKIRTIGRPDERFAEDRLRMIRAIRFAARLSFAIDPATLAAIQAQAHAVKVVSAERIGEELTRILTEGGPAVGMELLRGSGLMGELLPEMLALEHCEQPANFHPEGDVYRHTMLALSMLEPGCAETLAFGVLLHDIAKPRCRALSDNRVTFYGHCEHGAEMAREILRRLRRPRAVEERVAYLVRYHLRLCMAPRMRQATLKRMLVEDGFNNLLELSLLDALASNSYLGYYHFCRRALADLDGQKPRPSRLVTGHDLIAAGLTPGPRLGEILREIEDLQLEGTLTDREQALAYVRQRLAGPQPK
jgi:poly(A) polymerase